MITQLATIKSRLQILDTDTTYDPLLTSAIQAMSARFDKETSRTEPASHLFIEKMFVHFRVHLRLKS